MAPDLGSSWSSGSRRCGSTRSGSEPPTTRPRGRWAARPPRCCHWSPCSGPAVRAPWSWQATALRRSLEAAAPHLARDARVVLLLDHGGPEALVAAVLGGAGAGYRVVEARLGDPADELGGVVELVPPGGILPPGPLSRSNARLEPGPGDRGDPEVVPGPGLFAPPERIEARPFSPREAAATVLETTVEVLRARGEPASFDRLLGEILVGLDRSGALHRLVATEPMANPPIDDDAPPEPDRAGARPGVPGTPGTEPGGAAAAAVRGRTRPLLRRRALGPSPRRRRPAIRSSASSR